MRPPRATEKQWLVAVTRLAKLHGWHVYHTFNSFRSQAGFPDLVLCRPPRIIFAELKSDTGKVTPEQVDWLVNLGMSGAQTWVWRPADLENVEKVLR